MDIQERKTSRQEIIDGSGMHSLRSTSTSMAPSTSSMAPSTPIPNTNIYTSQLSVSASTMAPTSNHISISNMLYPSSSLVKPSTPIPDIYEWTHSANLKEHGNFLRWAHSTGKQMADPDECERFLNWAFSKVDIADVATPELNRAFLEWAHSISTMAALEESKRRFLKWPHSTSTMAAPDEHKRRFLNTRLKKWEHECERWSLQEEISKPFETALKRLQEEITQVLRDVFHLEDEDGDLYYFEDEHVYPDIIQDYMIYTCQKGMHGVYQCQNALWIWPNVRNISSISSPRDVGKKIIEKFPESDMIKGRPSVNDVGYVTIELSGKWIAKSIHKMQKDGIDTWAPKLPLERVIVDYSSLADEMHEDSYRRHAIGNTLKNILVYSKVEVTISHPRTMTTRSKRDWAQTVWGSHSEEDLLALRYGRADWIVYVTPVWEQEYLEKCFSTGKVKERVTSNRHKYARTSCAGYRSCTTEGYRSCAIELEEYMVSKAKTLVVENQDEGAMLLGYTAKDVLVCDLRYLYLKTHRLAECKFNLRDEMLKEEGNTFLYLLRTKANIRRITDRCRKYVNGIKDASELKLGEYEGWEEGEERMLGFKLLEFTEALKESCLSVLPHILCDYLYDLSNKFNSYYAHKYAPDMERNESIHSTLLLSEATAVVMEKCFHLLGITPTPSFPEESKILPPLSSLYYPRERLMDVDAWDLPRNSRFELFSFHTYTVKYRGYVDEGKKLFGCISVSDKCGLVSADGESHFFEPDFAHVPLFNHNWCNPIKIADLMPVYLGNPSSRHSVPLSSSIEIGMELYVIKNKNACYQLCNHKVEIDLSDFWDNKKADSACGRLTFFSVDNGSTDLYYILLKDAVDAALEVKFETKTRERKVSGYVLAYYGNDFLNECQCEPKYKYDYMALLFQPNDHVLEAGEIQLIKSVLAVPTKGSLVIIAYLEDAKSGKVIMDNTYKFKSKFSSCSVGTMSGIEGEDCYLDLKVDWKYQA